MSKIEFNWVRMKNFLSIKDEVIFDFKRHKGLNYIFGHSLDSKDGTKNGVGKSVIFCDAITFGLFGRTSKDISKPNIPYRAIGKKCEVGINFNIGNDEFDIVQNINPTSLTLMKNGVNITKSSISETQKYIEEEVLKTTYNIFKTSVILSINDTVNIFTLKAKEKREFIDSIFNLQQYGDMYIKITEDLKKNKSNINTKLSEHRRLSDVISDLTTSIDTNKQKNSNRINEINDKISVIDESITNYTGQIQELPEDKLNEVKRLQTLIAGNDTKINNINKENSNFKTEYSIKTELVGKYKEILPICCSDCVTVIDTKFNITKTNNELADLVNKVKSNMRDINGIKTELINFKTELTNVENYQNTRNEIINSNNRITTSISRLEQNKAILESMKVNTGTDAQDMVLMQNRYINDSNNLSLEINVLTEDRKYLEAAQYVVSPDGIKKWILTNLINNFNTRIRQYLDELGAQYTIIFDCDLSSKFLTPAGECEYNNFSAGERKRIDHAISFALRDIIASQGNLHSSILICDEIIDISVDNITIETLLNILKREAQSQGVFLISHKEEVSKSEIFDNIIELQKKDGQTTIIFDSATEKS